MIQETRETRKPWTLSNKTLLLCQFIAKSFRETPVHPVHEERWRPSQGIRFHSPSSDKSWRPSQGIVFSKIDEGQRAPFPMETRVSREPRINSILTEDPLSPTSTPSDLHVPRGRSSSVLPGNEPLFGPDSIHMVDCSRESDKVLEQAFSVWGSECVDEPRNGSIRAEKPSKAEINPSSPILRSSLERALINHQVNIQSHRNNTNLQPPQIKVELHSTLERAKNNYREILSRFDALIREPSISPPYLIRLQDMRDKVEIMKEEMTLCIHRMRDILRILCQIRQLTSMEPYEQVIYRRNTSRLNYLLHNIEVIRKHKLSRGSPYKLAFWQLSAFEKRRNNKLGRWRKLFGLCTKHMPTFIARKGRNPAFVSATKFRSLMLMKERFCNTHFTLFESWRNLAQPLVEFLNMKRIRLAPWHYTQSSWDKLEAAIENGPSRKINTPSKGDLTASRYDSLVSPKSVVKTRHSKTIKTLFIYQKTPHFKILRFRSLLGVHNGREAKFSSHSPPVPLMILHSHLSLSPTKSLRHPSVPESCCGPCPRLSIPEYYDGLSPELCHLVPGVAPRITFAEETVFSPLGFHIPRATLQEIEHASLKHKKTFWQYTLYRGPSQEKVQLHYCKCKESSELTAQLFLDEDIIGFDIEWKAQASAKDGIRKNVALIQLASEDRIALFHIARYSKGDTLEDLVAPTLQKIMESPKITKVGVAIKADCTRLRRYMSIDSRGLFELSHLYKVVRYSAGDVKKINKTTVSLAQQVEEHLELPLWKGDVRSSDWSEELNSEQIRCKVFSCSFDLTLTVHRRSIGFIRRVSPVPCPGEEKKGTLSRTSAAKPCGTQSSDSVGNRREYRNRQCAIRSRR